MRIDPGNTAQLEAWDGDQGVFWASNAERFDAGMARYHERLISAVAPGDDVIDIGCGAGQTTRDAARRGASALGVDLSSGMLERARAAAEREGIGNAAFLQADAQVHPFPDAAFDIAISRHGSMFFADPVAAFANIARALRDGGRLALLTWQPLERNEFISSFRTILAAGRELPAPPSDGPSPFSLSEPERVEEVLGAAGFTDVEMVALEEPMHYGADADDAFAFISGHFGGMAADLDDVARAAAFAALRADIAEHEGPDGVHYGSAAWLVTALRGRR